MYKRYFIFSTLIFILLLTSCSSNNSTSNNQITSVDRKSLHSARQVQSNPVEIKVIDLKGSNQKYQAECCNIIYPQIQSVNNKNTINKINSDITNRIDSYVNESDWDNIYNNDKDKKTNLNVNYSVIYNKNDILSIQVIIKIDGPSLADPIESHKQFTIDLKAGSIIELKDLFIQNSKYKSVLNNEIKKQIKDKEDSVLYHFVSVIEHQGFYFLGRELIICFDRGDIAPISVGFPEFKINLDSLNSILVNSYLDRIIA